MWAMAYYTTSYHYNVSLFIFVFVSFGCTWMKWEDFLKVWRGGNVYSQRGGEKVWQSEVSEKLVCRKHQVLLCDVVLCECMTCKSGLHQGVRCCFTIYTAITGWRGLQPPTGFSVDFFILNLKQNISSFTINYGEEPRRSWRIVNLFKCELTCWTVKEQIRTYSLTCIKQSQ